MTLLMIRSAPADPVDAATLLLLRQQSDGPQVYMVERHRGNAFVAGAHVFVGGRVDAQDRTNAVRARCTGLDDATAAARLGLADTQRALALYVAAIREAFEESALLLAIDQAGNEVSSSDRPNELRRTLNSGNADFATGLEQHALWLPLDRLKYLAHWITPPFESRRFDTRFFVAAAPSRQTAVHDPKETSSGRWWNLDEILTAHANDQVKLAPPTVCVLEGLRHHHSVQTCLAAAPDAPVDAIHPRLLEGVQPPTILLPGDHCYDDPTSKRGPLNRVVGEGAHWVYVRS